MSSILTVSQLNRYMHFKVQSDTKLKGVAVKGELSNYTVNFRSGHAYFTLKDEDSALKGVMFSTAASKLRFTPENGMSVLAVGNIDVYERDGVYQLIASELQPLGSGAVKLGIEQLKRKLSDKGVFDSSKKKKIPECPKSLAVVTSPTGAALQDILNILKRRYPFSEISVFEAQVQGEAAPQSISKALAKADKSGADTIILARGGGSDEDLMPFNSETVTMAVFGCSTPVISAVGHETDTSLSDYAADLRAPTPSAAAELAVPDMSAVKDKLSVLTSSLERAFESQISERTASVVNLYHRLSAVSPLNSVNNSRLQIDGLTKRLDRSAEQIILSGSAKLDKINSQLTALSPFAILERGYLIAMKNGSPVYSVSQLSDGDELELILSDGSVSVMIRSVKVN